MSGILESLKPQKVFYYFEQISEIPRGSGNTKAISDYCVQFAKDRGLKYIQDTYDNVIIIKEATSGRDQDKGIILQAHLDMVNEKNPGVEHDFNQDGIRLLVDGEFVRAKDTTLGADNGIGVAYGLAILDSDDISHPMLEVVLTADEEIGLLGAAGLDKSLLNGKYMMNIDSGEQGVITASCAGGMRSICHLELKHTAVRDVIQGTSYTNYEIKITGLKSGHSGMDIHLGRANANLLIGRLLRALQDEVNIAIATIEGGDKDNVIAYEAVANIWVSQNEEQKLTEIIEDYKSIFRTEYHTSDGQIDIIVTKSEAEEGKEKENVIIPEDAEKILFFLTNVPDGVQYMEQDLVDVVETSLNLGIFKVDSDHMQAKFAVRSSVLSRKMLIGTRLKSIIEFLGGTYTYSGVYPAWRYERESALRDAMINIHERMNGKKPVIKAIHAGLECGYFKEAIPDLEIVSIGPDMYDIHTTEERVNIASVASVYDYIIEILMELQ